MTSHVAACWLALLLGSLSGCSANAEASTVTELRLHYTGTLVRFSERSEGEEPCTFRQAARQASGYLRLRRVSDRELEAYEEAVGCRISAGSEDGQNYSATSAACAWDDTISLRDLGVVSRTFERWNYDQQSGRIEASGEIVRETGAGQRMVSCFELSLVLGATNSPL